MPDEIRDLESVRSTPDLSEPADTSAAIGDSEVLLPLEVRRLARASEHVNIEGKARKSIVIHRVLRSRTAALGAAIMALAVVLAVFGPYLAPHDPIAISLPNRLMPPSAEHWMGTDHLGRDVFSRTLAGARVAMQVGLLSIGVAGLLGMIIGLITGFYGKTLDGLLMAVMDVLLAFPSLLLALLIVAALGPSLANAIIAVAVGKVPQFARLVRGSVLSVKESDYVLAARAIGARNRRVMLKHILVNSLAPWIVYASLSFGTAIVTAAALSFLGLGAQPPIPEWGAMLNEGQDFLRSAPWVSTFPGIAIVVTVIGSNLLGDGLRDALDPRLKNT